MRLDLGDKAFLMASNEALLAACRKEMGVLGGVAAQSVRKLGVDYAVSKRGEKEQESTSGTTGEWESEMEQAVQAGPQESGHEGGVCGNYTAHHVWSCFACPVQDGLEGSAKHDWWRRTETAAGHVCGLGSGCGQGRQGSSIHLYQGGADEVGT